MSESIEGVKNGLRRFQPLLQVLLIGFLVLLLQIPIAMVDGLIRERERTRGEAVAEVQGKWGGQQQLIGPFLAVPYIHRWTELDPKSEKTIARSEVKQAYFLPDELNCQVTVESQQRYRGIFSVPVYRAVAHTEGRFLRPDFSPWGIAETDVLWRRAELVLKIADARALQTQVLLDWGGQSLPFEPGSGEYGGALGNVALTEAKAALAYDRPAPQGGVPGGASGIHVRLQGQFTEAEMPFAFTLDFNGSIGLRFVPFGRQTRIEMDSNWPDPSFQGSWLPGERQVGASGCSAVWDIPYLGRNYPQKWREPGKNQLAVGASLFGVDFIAPVDNYRMSRRSVKYESLFLLLTFLTIWLFEVLVKVRVHPLQYLLVGAAMCLFYLLELALSEHLGFLPAYLVASLAVVCLVTAYCRAVLQTGKRATLVGAVLAALYLYLFILLRQQDYALLIGAVGLFGVLATVMYLTRRIDWFQGGTNDDL